MDKPVKFENRGCRSTFAIECCRRDWRSGGALKATDVVVTSSVWII
jgi:hypothetical protein